MSFAPQTLLDLQALWVSHGGYPLGIVGDTTHQSRGSYHNGFDVASKLWGTTNLELLADSDYSYRLPRDRVKSNAASAIDLGKLNGSLPNLQKFSRWLVAQAQANPTKYHDIREIIYSPDGLVVKRWSGPDNKVYNVVLDNDVARGHLTHTHISAHRDSEFRDKRALFADYFTAVVTPPDTATEEPMGLALHLAATTDNTPLDAFGTAKIKGAHSIVRVRDKLFLTPLTDGTDLGVVQRGELLQPIDSRAGDRKSVVVFNHLGESHVAMFIDVVFTPLPKPVDTTPYSKADVNTRVGAALERARSVVVADIGTRIDEVTKEALIP